MDLIVLKLVFPPFLILLASLAGRRWGDAIGGWLVGLPLTSGPISAFLALQYGTDFAAVASNGSLIGTVAQACFCLGYALVARRGWVPALIAGIAAYAGSALFMQELPLTHWGFFVAALVTLTVSARLIPFYNPLRNPIASPWWDLPARMLVATVIVVTLTAAASLVGAQMAGILACFPVFASILAVFTHRMRSAEMAMQVLRGMVLSLYGFATFFFLIGLIIVEVGTLPAFAIATVSSLLMQSTALYFIRRGKIVYSR
ncbi:Uncharacterised protein [Leminorella richardii]|uniref:Uncharacterized protein n=1 Tax=Leminorella richardii TaxID=158841 RepID=A0A2X4VE36_9GAMM|nr:hypothetical protein [Leminorella richardii]SQI43540.1 Uncharacterised protein [Leminorella richardii]